MKFELKRIGGITALELNNPPVSALDNRIRSHLWDAIERLETDAGLKAIVILNADKCFSAGVDIREFDNTMEETTLSRLIDRVESCKNL